MFCCAKNSPARLTLARWLEHSAGFIELAGDPLNGRAIATGGRAGVSDAEFRLPVFEIGFQHGDGFVDAADGVVLASALLSRHSVSACGSPGCLSTRSRCESASPSFTPRVPQKMAADHAEILQPLAGRPVESHRDLFAQPPYSST